MDTCQLRTQKVCEQSALSAEKEADFLHLKWILTWKEGVGGEKNQKWEKWLTQANLNACGVK